MLRRTGAARLDVDRRRVFIRGDLEPGGTLDITDAIVLLNYLFLGGAEPGCRAAADASGDGRVGLSDAVTVLWHLSLGGPSPASPFPGCGPPRLPGDVELGCEEPPAFCSDSDFR